jgi:glycosyltransferase involved in cell wall biosynthesis
MRIAFVITRADDLGGAQIHVRDLSTALRAAGHEPVVLAGAEGVLAQELRGRGVPFHALRHLTRPIRPLNDLRAVWEIRRVLRRIRPDIISTHSSKAGILGRIAGRSLGIPTLMTAHGWAFADGIPQIQKRVYRTIEGAAAPLSPRIVTVCESDRRLAIRERVARPSRLVTIHNAVPDIGAALRARPALSPPRLLMVARLAPQKDHATLLRALSGLLDLDWRLELIGTGPLRFSLGALAGSLGLASRVSFAGFCQEIPHRLARAQAFLLISNWEGFPRSILEAMRAGLPVVASDVGGVRESVVDEETGFIVPAKDVHYLRDRLRSLITEPESRARMGAAGRARYEAHFTFDTLVGRTVALYKDIVSPVDPSAQTGAQPLDARTTPLADNATHL